MTPVLDNLTKLSIEGNNKSEEISLVVQVQR